MAQSTSKSVTIAASPDAVLDVIAELADYPAWAGGIKQVEVLEEIDGWPVQARFTVDQSPIRDTYVLDYSWDVDEDSLGTVSWTLAEKGSMITKLDGSYLLAAVPGGSQVTYHLSVDVSIPLPGIMKRSAEKKIVTTALDDLSARVAG